MGASCSTNDSQDRTDPKVLKYVKKKKKPTRPKIAQLAHVSDETSMNHYRQILIDEEVIDDDMDLSQSHQLDMLSAKGIQVHINAKRCDDMESVRSALRGSVHSPTLLLSTQPHPSFLNPEDCATTDATEMLSIASSSDEGGDPSPGLRFLRVNSENPSAKSSREQSRRNSADAQDLSRFPLPPLPPTPSTSKALPLPLPRWSVSPVAGSDLEPLHDDANLDMSSEIHMPKSSSMASTLDQPSVQGLTMPNSTAETSRLSLSPAASGRVSRCVSFGGTSLIYE